METNRMAKLTVPSIWYSLSGLDPFVKGPGMVCYLLSIHDGFNTMPFLRNVVTSSYLSASSNQLKH